MDFEGFGAVLPFIVFLLAIIIGNLGDAKKPKAKSRPFPQGQPVPDIRPPKSRQAAAEPETETEKTAAEVQHEDVGKPIPSASHEPLRNSYQIYLEEKRARSAAGEVRPAEEAVPDTPVPAPSSRSRLQNMPLMQAIAAAEILDRPRALRRRRR